MRSVAFLILSMFLGQNLKAQTSNCPESYDYLKPNYPELPTYSKILDLPFNYDVFVPFIQTPNQYVYCFAQEYFPVQFYKVVVPYSTETMTQGLAIVPDEMLDLWGANLNPEQLLWGVTTIKFSLLPVEKINKAYIFLRTDSERWVLWHEFSHLIILQETAKSGSHFIRDFDPVELDKLKQDIDSKVGRYSIQDSKILFNYLDGIFEFKLRNAIEEVFIEANLIYLLTQNRLLVKPTKKELEDSVRHIKQYDIVMINEVKKLNKIISNFKELADENPDIKVSLEAYKRKILFMKNQSNILLKKSKEYLSLHH